MRNARFYMGMLAGSIIGMAAAATSMTMMPQLQRQAKKMVRQGKKMMSQNNIFDQN